MPHDLRSTEYQSATNFYGNVTANQISHKDSKEPCSYYHATQPTVYDDMKDSLAWRNYYNTSDQLVTVNQIYHGPKVYNDKRDYQPSHDKAAGSQIMQFCKPDFNQRVGRLIRGKRYNHGTGKVRPAQPKLSSTIWATPSKIYSQRYLYKLPTMEITPSPDNYNSSSVRMKANPYMTTNKLAYRDLSQDVSYLKVLDAMGDKNPDVAIKIIDDHPLVDPLNVKYYNSTSHPSLDSKHPDSNRKLFFKYPPYNGRFRPSFQSANHICSESTYQGSYSRPFQLNNAYNHHPLLEVNWRQPPMGAIEVMMTPGMYVSENHTYGSGRDTSYFFDHKNTPIWIKGVYPPKK